MQPTVNPSPPASLLPSNRLQSLDVLRGLIMLLLAAESCHLYIALNEEFATGIPNAVVEQFFHHPWHGLRFWDLVQPAFMTMAGAALYISFYNKSKKGITWETNFRHVAIRCFKLFLFGTALHCIYAGKMVWELWNVLTQLAFTTLIAYAIIRKSSLFQIIFSIALLILTELLYRFVLIIDLRGWNRFAWVFEVMGMNAIFIYLFFETVGVQWLNGAVAIFTNGFTGLFNTPEGIQAIFSDLITLFVEWYLCYWLYKRRIFLKL